MHWTERRERYRSYLAGDKCLHPGSVYDPISARIAEDLGFEIGMFAGSVASMTVLGAPDLIVLTLSEFAGQAYRINRAGNLPLTVDADHGYGNALNVKRTVEELETAGVAALSVEDTDLPQPFGTVGTTRLIPVDEGVGKMKAAIAGRQDKSLVIAGRTSAVAVNGPEDAAVRATAYQNAGVDAIFLVGVKTRAELETATADITLPIFLGGATPELADLGYLADQGVRVALQGHQPFAAGINAVYETLKALREGVPPAELNAVASSELMKKLVREADYKDSMDNFLS